MASVYTRPDSDFIYVQFKNPVTGKWQRKPTPFRKDNLGDRKQADLLAVRLTAEERLRKPVSDAEHWPQWVERWILDKYGKRKLTTIAYARHWRHLYGWLSVQGINSPRQVAYRHALEYRESRVGEGASVNTVIHELKFLGQIMQEALRRGFTASNPITRLGMERDKPKPKEVWTDNEIARVAEAIKTQPHWLRCTFYLGLYQAARLRQIPRLRDIDFERGKTGTITYETTKGDKPFTHPIDPRAVVHFKALVRERLRDEPKAVLLCDLPTGYPPSVTWREFLDSLGLPHLCHHGLRNTWITRACLNGVNLGMAKRFVNHGSTAVHEIYQRLSSDDLQGVSMQIRLPDIPV